MRPGNECGQGTIAARGHVSEDLHMELEPMRLENPCGWRTHAAGEPMQLENPCGWRTHAAGEPMQLENPCGWRTHAAGEPLLDSTKKMLRSVAVNSPAA